MVWRTSGAVADDAPVALGVCANGAPISAPTVRRRLRQWLLCVCASGAVAHALLVIADPTQALQWV